MIRYAYDAAGNRILKEVNGQQTWYVRDAQGNTLSVYRYGDNSLNSGALTQAETHLYGSSRLGITTPGVNVQAIAPPMLTPLPGLGAGINRSFTRGKKFFELSNHMGNVLATVSDKKFGVDSDGDGVIDHYAPDVESAQDYYSFGMMIPGRQYSAGSDYRYGFNGKENDIEVKGEGNQQDYGMRVYDPRLGRFLSVDPITASYPMLTPYQFASNRPIDGVDLDGKEWSKTESTDDKGNTIINYEIKIKVIDKEQCVDNARLASLMATTQNLLTSAFNASAKEKVKYVFSINYETVDKVDEKNDYFMVIDNKYTLEKSLHGEATGNTQKGKIVLNTNNKYFSTGYDIALKKVYKIEHDVPRNIDDIASTFAHEMLHNSRLDHPNEEKFIRDIRQYNPDGSRSTVSDETIRNNIMNSLSNRLIPYKLPRERKNLTPGQIEYVDKVVEKEQKENSKGSK